MPHRVTELHNIQSIENVPSIMTHGLLSHERASMLDHVNISMDNVQLKRSKVTIPNGRKLHTYACLFFHARNPMMYRRRNITHGLTILCFSTDVLNIPGSVVTDQNAASAYVSFHSPDELDQLDFELIYAHNWDHDNQIMKWRHSSIKGAEVLVPDVVPSSYIQSAYVSND